MGLAGTSEGNTPPRVPVLTIRARPSIRGIGAVNWQLDLLDSPPRACYTPCKAVAGDGPAAAWIVAQNETGEEAGRCRG
jgi:hypothetical protein